MLQNKGLTDKLKQDLQISNVMTLPKIEKVVLNIGVGKFVKDEATIAKIESDLALIAGQKPIKTLAKKSIASFGVRQGTAVGLKVTLRKKLMKDFLGRLIRVVLPRVRDFNGIPLKSIDRDGNLTIAIKDHHVFPELNLDKAANSFSFEITITTSAKNKEIGEKLLRAVGLPLKSSQSL